MRRAGVVLPVILLLALIIDGTSAGTAAGGAPVLDKAQLTALLDKTSVCRVVDARSEKQRRGNPLKGALVYGKDMDLKSAGTVLVIADSDRLAREVAGKLAASGKFRVYAIKGGYKTWKLVTGEGLAEAEKAEPGRPRSFIIPKNTCESGETIQEFKE